MSLTSQLGSRQVRLCAAANAGSFAGGTSWVICETGQTATPDFRVDVVSEVRGQLRTQVDQTGRPAVCSPDGCIAQASPCA